MIKEITPSDTTVKLEQDNDVVISNSSEFKAPEKEEENNESEDKQEFNLSDYATDYLQSILDWRKDG